MNAKKIKIILFVVFLILLCLPLAQMITHIPKIVALKGYVILHEKPVFSIQTWLDGDYQDNFDKYINDNIGYRPDLVRVHNQVEYSFFGKPNAAGVIVGKDNYFYERDYINAYNGLDFLGEDSILKKVNDLKWLQDTLASMDKTLLVCLAAGKASFYPEYFPEQDVISPPPSATNYKVYAKMLAEQGINHIDFNKWFMDMKAQDTCRCSLYPRYGIHWSSYGSTLVMDSLIRYISAKRSISMTNLHISEIEISKKLRHSDYDLGNALNLMFQLKSQPMCYPKFEWVAPDNVTKPKAIIISDSFFWEIYNTGICNMVFNQGEFWYYNAQIYSATYNGTDVKDVSLLKTLQNTDVVIFLSTEATLKKFSWDFAETAIKTLRTGKDTFDKNAFDKAVKEKMEQIRQDSEWMKMIEEKAKANQIPVDSMLKLDAIWVLENP